MFFSKMKVVKNKYKNWLDKKGWKTAWVDIKLWYAEHFKLVYPHSTQS
jgi:hypothetical protein